MSLRSRRLARLALVFAVLVLARRADALDEPGETRGLPCRPTVACTAEIVAPGAVEVEAGSITRNLGGVRQVSFPFLAKVTLARWVQVQVGGNGYTELRGAPPARYFDNVTVGAKLHLLDQGDRLPAIALSAAASEPASGSAGPPPHDDVLFTAYVTKDLGPLHADLNAGLNLLRLNGHAEPQAWVAVALSMSLPPPFGVMLENYYFSGAGDAASHDGGVLVAFSHSARPWLTFDAGSDVGYFPGSRSVSGFVGMTIIPVLLLQP